MAQLGSPGVQVNVIDESFYNPATPGTIPLIVLATSQNKTNASGTGIATGTSLANANSLYLATSQKDLTDRYGIPTFQKDAGGNAIQGSELNEYGLFAAYSFLGASNSAYILRAGVDLGALAGSSTVPVGDPLADTYWLDTSATRFGLFEWNATSQQFTSKTATTLYSSTDVDVDFAPKASIGFIGDYAVVVVESSNTVWYKNKAANWVKVGSYGSTSLGSNSITATDWLSSHPVITTKAFASVSTSTVTHTGVASQNVQSNSGSGNPTFNVIRGGAQGSTLSVSVNAPGTGYAVGDTLKILGTAVGGATTANDIAITVATITGGGATGPIGTITHTGVGATVSTLGFSIQVGEGSPVDYFIDAGTSGGPGGAVATPAEIATQLNALISLQGVGVNVTADNKLEFIANTPTTIVLDDPSTGSTALGSTATLGLVAGTYYTPAVEFSDHTKVPFWASADDFPRPAGSVWVKTTEFNLGSKWTMKRFNSDTRLFETKDAPVYKNTEEAIAKLDPLNGGTGVAVGQLFINGQYNKDTIANFKLMYRAKSGVASASVTTAWTGVSSTFNIAESVKGTSTLTQVTGISSGTTVAEVVANINNSALTQVEATYNAGVLTLTHKQGGEIYLDGAVWTALGFSGTVDSVYTGPTGTAYDFRISNWAPLADLTQGYQSGPTKPTDVPADNTIWYATYQDKVDIMVHDGTTWKGLRQVYPDATVIVSASRPTNTGRVVGDIWVDTSSQDEYGRNIKRWNAGSTNWDAIDVTDHTSQFGIVFADARWGLSGATGDTLVGTIESYWSNDYLDPDAPDPAAYPRGMLLWNTRRSGFNIKQYKKGYINTSSVNTRYDINIGGQAMTGYAGADGNQDNRWVSVSGQDLNQVAYFGRKAQRAYVVGQLKVAINTNQRILDEDNIFFNLIAAPGYPELISDMVNLNSSRNGTALVVGDTPLRLPSDANSLINYGTDYSNSGIDGEDGLHTNSDHLAVYYPSGLTTDLSGTNVVVPASHMMLRTIAISDQRSFQWFAPAGTRRGGISNASSVGYLKDGSFIPVSLNQGVRDQMATIKVNPITNIPGAGLVAFGQYTKTGVNSSLDRINVARLVSYLRRQLGIITKPFLFEPNDKQTRGEIKNVCESLMLDLVSLRGIYDFIVVCDESNNTSSVISNNQLYVDIAVEPVKAVEFIYIPLRLKNVGDIKTQQ